MIAYELLETSVFTAHIHLPTSGTVLQSCQLVKQSGPKSKLLYCGL